MRNLQTVLDAYIECALWSSHAPEDEPAEYLDGLDYPLLPSTYADMQADCESFLSMMPDNPLSDEQVGHNFWLTRNGHGAGFWDLGLGTLGVELTQIAKQFGGVDLYVDGGYIRSM